MGSYAGMSSMIAEFRVATSDGNEKGAICAFGTFRDLKEIALWPRQVKGDTHSQTLDALEFAKLLSKRWRFYQGQGLTVAGIPALKRKISAQENIEIAFFCVARARWANPQILGIALARRTWCGHLILDFLATHPLRLMAGPQHISGIGKGLLYGMAEVAFAVRAKVLWGEATETSAPIYQHIFELKRVDDLLLVPRASLASFRAVMREKVKRSRLL
jgi:hypothetical protein